MLPIVGFQKTSLIDYPERLSTIFFTSGCNFHCPYCHNPQLAQRNSDLSLLPEELIWEHLTIRKNLIDGVVITGGEPTLHGAKLANFLQRVKEIGYLVKLDTNGSNPALLKKLIADDLLDYVAMDIKTSLNKYADIINQSVNIEQLSESIDLLKLSSNLKLIELEFRSTLHPLLHNEDIFTEMVNLVAGSPRYVIQTFKNQITLDPAYSQTQPFTEEQMKNFQKLAIRSVSECLIRE